MALKRYKKDPDAVLDYTFDFAALTNGSDTSPQAADYLQAGEKLASHQIVADSGITVESSSIVDNDTRVVVWLSGGTPGTSYTVTCRTTTDNTPPRVDDHSIIIKIVEK